MSTFKGTGIVDSWDWKCRTGVIKEIREDNREQLVFVENNQVIQTYPRVMKYLEKGETVQFEGKQSTKHDGTSAIIATKVTGM